MRATTLDEFMRQEEFYNCSRTSQCCGLELEPEDNDRCALFAFAHRLAYSIELKGGGNAMADTEPKGDKPDFKGNLEVVAWMNADRYGKKFVTIQLGNRANLFKNEPKQAE